VECGVNGRLLAAKSLYCFLAHVWAELNINFSQWVLDSDMSGRCRQGRNEREQGRTTPRAPNRWGGAEKSHNVASTFFNVGHLLPNELSVGHKGAKFVGCTGAI